MVRHSSHGSGKQKSRAQRREKAICNASRENIYFEARGGAAQRPVTQLPKVTLNRNPGPPTSRTRSVSVVHQHALGTRSRKRMVGELLMDGARALSPEGRARPGSGAMEVRKPAAYDDPARSDRGPVAIVSITQPASPAGWAKDPERAITTIGKPCLLPVITSQRGRHLMILPP